ncbi:MAG: DUF92 domain-containing protein, partial [Bacteroidota bacterium]
AFQLKEFFFITLLGFGGMLVDSLLGSAFQRQYFDGSQWSDQPIGDAKGSIRGISWMTNDMVNLLANVIAIGLTYLLF